LGPRSRSRFSRAGGGVWRGQESRFSRAGGGVWRGQESRFSRAGGGVWSPKFSNRGVGVLVPQNIKNYALLL